MTRTRYIESISHPSNTHSQMKLLQNLTDKITNAKATKEIKRTTVKYWFKFATVLLFCNATSIYLTSALQSLESKSSEVSRVADASK